MRSLLLIWNHAKPNRLMCMCVLFIRNIHIVLEAQIKSEVQKRIEKTHFSVCDDWNEEWEIEELWIIWLSIYPEMVYHFPFGTYSAYNHTTKQYSYKHAFAKKKLQKQTKNMKMYRPKGQRRMSNVIIWNVSDDDDGRWLQSTFTRDVLYRNAKNPIIVTYTQYSCRSILDGIQQNDTDKRKI